MVRSVLMLLMTCTLASTGIVYSDEAARHPAEYLRTSAGLR